jgi:hypothetical protein
MQLLEMQEGQRSNHRELAAALAVADSSNHSVQQRWVGLEPSLVVVVIVHKQHIEWVFEHSELQSQSCVFGLASIC